MDLRFCHTKWGLRFWFRNKNTAANNATKWSSQYNPVMCVHTSSRPAVVPWLFGRGIFTNNVVWGLFAYNPTFPIMNTENLNHLNLSRMCTEWSRDGWSALVSTVAEPGAHWTHEEGRPPQLEAPPPSSASSSSLSPHSPLVHTLSTKMVECLHMNTLTLVMVLEPQGLPLPAGRLAPPPQVSLSSLLPASLPLSPHALHTCPILLATTKEESSPPFPFLLLVCAI